MRNPVTSMGDSVIEDLLCMSKTLENQYSFKENGMDISGVAKANGDIGNRRITFNERVPKANNDSANKSFSRILGTPDKSFTSKVTGNEKIKANTNRQKDVSRGLMMLDQPLTPINEGSREKSGQRAMTGGVLRQSQDKKHGSLGAPGFSKPEKRNRSFNKSNSTTSNLNPKSSATGTLKSFVSGGSYLKSKTQNDSVGSGKTLPKNDNNNIPPTDSKDKLWKNSKATGSSTSFQTKNSLNFKKTARGGSPAQFGSSGKLASGNSGQGQDSPSMMLKSQDTFILIDEDSHFQNLQKNIQQMIHLENYDSAASKCLKSSIDIPPIRFILDCVTSAMPDKNAPKKFDRTSIMIEKSVPCNKFKRDLLELVHTSKSLNQNPNLPLNANRKRQLIENACLQSIDENDELREETTYLEPILYTNPANSRKNDTDHHSIEKEGLRLSRSKKVKR
jgi:hypothetical protein